MDEMENDIQNYDMLPSWHVIWKSNTRTKLAYQPGKTNKAILQNVTKLDYLLNNPLQHNRPGPPSIEQYSDPEQKSDPSRTFWKVDIGSPKITGSQGH